MSKCYKCGEQWTNENRVETPLLCPKCSLAAPTGSAGWEYSENLGVNMWTWKPRTDVRYFVTQYRSNIEAHVSRGTGHRFVSTIGSYATVAEARQRAIDHWQND